LRQDFSSLIALVLNFPFTAAKKCWSC